MLRAARLIDRDLRPASPVIVRVVEVEDVAKRRVDVRERLQADRERAHDVVFTVEEAQRLDEEEATEDVRSHHVVDVELAAEVVPDRFVPLILPEDSGYVAPEIEAMLEAGEEPEELLEDLEALLEEEDAPHDSPHE